MSYIWSEQNKIHLVLAPALDRWNGGTTGLPVHMENYKKCTFLIPVGSSDTETCGQGGITVKAGATAAACTTEIAFKYRTVSSGGTYGTLTDSTGFNTTNALSGTEWTYIVEVDASTVAAAGTDFDVIKLSLSEELDQAITSCAIAVLSEPRYPQAILQTSTP